MLGVFALQKSAETIKQDLLGGSREQFTAICEFSDFESEIQA